MTFHGDMPPQDRQCTATAKATGKRCQRTVPERTLLHALADARAARPELHEIPDPERPRPERTTR